MAALGGGVGADDEVSDRFAGGNLQPARADPGGEAVHRQLDLSVETVAAHREDFEDHRAAGAQGDRFGEGGAIAVSQGHVHGPGGDGKVGLRLAHEEAVGILRIVAGAAKEVAQGEAVEAVLLDLDLAEDIGRTDVVGRPIVGVAVRRDLHGTDDVIKFGHIREGFDLAVFRDMLHEDEGIGGTSDPLRGDLDPPDFTLFRLELAAVDIGGGEEAAGDIEREGDLRRLLRLVIRLDLVGRGVRGECLGWPRDGADARGRGLLRGGVVALHFAEGETVEMAFATLIGEVVHLDEVGAVGGRGEIDDSAGAVHEEIGALVIRHDDHGRQSRIDSGGGAVDRDALALFALEGVEINRSLCHRGVADGVERQLHRRFDAVVRDGAGDLVDGAHGKGAGRGNAEPREDAGFVHTDGRVGGDGDEELVLHRFAVGSGDGFGGDFRGGKLERGDLLDVFPGDRHLDAAAGLAAHRQGREEAR